MYFLLKFQSILWKMDADTPIPTDNILIVLTDSELPEFGNLAAQFPGILRLKSADSVVAMLKDDIKREYYRSYNLCSETLKPYFKDLTHAESAEFSTHTGLEVPQSFGYMQLVLYVDEYFDVLKHYFQYKSADITEMFNSDGIQDEIHYVRQCFAQSNNFSLIHQLYDQKTFSTKQELAAQIWTLDHLTNELANLANQPGPDFGASLEEKSLIANGDEEDSIERAANDAPNFASQLHYKLTYYLTGTDAFKQLRQMHQIAPDNFRYVPLGGISRQNIFPHFERLYNRHCEDRDQPFPFQMMPQLSVMFAYEEAVHGEAVGKIMQRRQDQGRTLASK